MSSDDFEIGQRVSFGRPRGQKRTGTILELKITHVLIKDDEGTEWKVAHSLIKHINDKPKKKDLEYHHYDEVNNLIYEAIYVLYRRLDPEFISGDGGANHKIVMKLKRENEIKLSKLQEIVGPVTENQINKWMKKKRETTARLEGNPS